MYIFSGFISFLFYFSFFFARSKFYYGIKEFFNISNLEIYWERIFQAVILTGVSLRTWRDCILNFCIIRIKLNFDSKFNILECKYDISSPPLFYNCTEKSLIVTIIPCVSCTLVRFDYIVTLMPTFSLHFCGQTDAQFCISICGLYLWFFSTFHRNCDDSLCCTELFLSLHFTS